MKAITSPVPILGFAAYSGTGKTTLLKKLIPLLKSRQLRVGIIKHAHHQFDIDHPGKDSYELRKAGADRMLVASSRRWALMVENETNNTDPQLQTLLYQIDPAELDLVLVEGFKSENFPKIELHRSATGHDWLFPNDPSIIAAATDSPPDNELLTRQLQLLDINNPLEITDFICATLLPPDRSGR